MSNDSQLENQHQALKAQSARYSQKVSPLLVMCGLLQEAMGMNQQLVAHADALRSELIKKNESVNENGGAIQSIAPGKVAGEDRGGAARPGVVDAQEEHSAEVGRVSHRMS